jgi:hypothetical protein
MLPPMIDRTSRLPLLLAALAALTLFSALASPQAQAATTCPDFTILHDDRIDGVSLPHGRYGVTVFSGVTCQDTTRLLQKFLQSGKTSDGWKINSKAVFTKGSQSWQIKKGGGSGGGGDGEGGGRNVCPAPFRVLHNDRIGDLSIPAGSYRITARRISCADATDQFRRFLQFPGGNLPDNWKVRPLRAKFRNSGTGESFRIKRLGN